MTAMSEAQLDGFVGFTAERNVESGLRINVLVEGDTIGGLSGIVRGEEYYLSLAGPVLRTDIAAGALSRRIGRGTSATQVQIEASFGDIELIGGGSTDTAFRISGAPVSVTVDGSTLLISRHSDISGAAGTVHMPDGSALSPGDVVSFKDFTGGWTVDTTDGSTIDEQASILLVQYESHECYWRGSAWGIRQ